MDEIDQFNYFIEKVIDMIRIHLYDENIYFTLEHREMIIIMLYDKLNYDEYKYKEIFMIRNYICSIIYNDNSEYSVYDMKGKIKFGYYNNKSLDDFNHDINVICEHIYNYYNLICSFDDIYNDDLKTMIYYVNKFPYIKYYDIQKIKMTSLINHCSDEEIQNNIQHIHYNDFLNTLYWKYIRFSVLKKHKFQCLFCGTKDNLQVHHRTYKNHGLEHKEYIQDKDLIVVCEKCHNKIHGYITEY